MNKENEVETNIEQENSSLDQLAPKVSIQDAFKRFQK